MKHSIFDFSEQQNSVVEIRFPDSLHNVLRVTAVKKYTANVTCSLLLLHSKKRRDSSGIEL